MSLAEFLRMGIKTRLSRCGTALSVAQRTENMNLHRHELRHSVIFKRRNLTELTFSPIDSPKKSIKLTSPLKPMLNQKQIKPDKQLEKLKQWQAEKKKKLQEQKAKKKPAFKVCHVNDSNWYNGVDKALTEIKGKRISAKPKPEENAILRKVLPTSAYSFKAPANVKPMCLDNSKRKAATRYEAVKKDIKHLRTVAQKLNGAPENKLKIPNKKLTTKVISNRTGRVTKSKTKFVPSPDSALNKTFDKNEDTTPDESTKLQFSNSELACAILSPKDHGTSQLVTVITPPMNNNLSSTSYISPYVTVSRGKLNALKEYHKKMNGEAYGEGDKNTNVSQFTELMNGQTNRLKALCDQWNNYKETENPGEDICDMVNVAIGQTELLLNKKFKQFKNLIESCGSGTSERPITVFDLQGFWDTTMLQVNNIDKRFANLDTLKSNNWEEIQPATKSKIKDRGAKPKQKVAASSSLMAAIKEARKKKKMPDLQEVVIITPSNRKNTRKSLSTSALSSACKIDSPKLIANRDNSYIITSKSPGISQSPPPPRSILKSGNASIRQNRQSKAVLFSSMNENKENFNVSPSISDMPNGFTPRRSMRLLSKVNSTK